MVAVKEKKDQLYWKDFENIFSDIKEVWVEEVNQIIKQRFQTNEETVCQLNDLLTAKILFDTYDSLKRALLITDEMCYQKGYTILSMDNRLDKE